MKNKMLLALSLLVLKANIVLANSIVLGTEQDNDVYVLEPDSPIERIIRILKFVSIPIIIGVIIYIICSRTISKIKIKNNNKENK